ncbi:hypothetical protein [Cyclobacterium xiamenense]|uniref:hypothetical protein n=1 Tax=Cyclobacterium xiamenense TaxID=1297121 RepID=UPI0012BA2813|nr:hypothetical protein [Cyclobacterium xiamenense]
MVLFVFLYPIATSQPPVVTLRVVVYRVLPVADKSVYVVREFDRFFQDTAAGKGIFALAAVFVDFF